LDPTPGTKPTALIVDPDRSARDVLSGPLCDAGYVPQVADSLAAAQTLREHFHHDLVLVEVELPDGSGLDLARQVLEGEEDSAVLVLAARASLDSAVEALRLRASDYLVKPFGSPEVVRERIEAAARHLERVRQQHRLVQNLESLATRDPLTGLFNHAYFQERLGNEISRCERYEHPLGLMFVDVDRFKEVNDSHGHQAGDHVLTTISEIVRGRSRITDVHFRLREHDIAARYGGDEFVLVLPETPKTGTAITAERLRKAVEEHPFDLEVPAVTLSIGVASFPDDGEDRDGLIRAADTALYVAKASGRNRVVSYGPGLAGATGRRIAEPIVDVERLAALERTIEEQSLDFAYQPIVEAGKRRVAGYEAFCRPQDPTFDGPIELIVTAEQTGRVGDLGRVMREQALKPADRLPEGCQLFVNLHPQEINDPSLLEPGPEVMRHAGRVVLEITRTRDISDQRRLERNLNTLRGFGFKIALDDLREGYLGLNAVTRLEPDFLRLSMELLREVHGDPRESRLIRHYLELAREEQITVIAGRIETEEDCRIAVDLGCGWLQGYHFGAPQPPFAEPMSP